MITPLRDARDIEARDRTEAAAWEAAAAMRAVDTVLTALEVEPAQLRQ